MSEEIRRTDRALRRELVIGTVLQAVAGLAVLAAEQWVLRVR